MTAETKPMRPRQFTTAERAKLFPLDFTVVLERNGKPEITVRENWERQNLVRLGPYALGVGSFGPRVHILAAPVFQALFAAIKTAGFWQDIVTHDGGYVPRLKRGVELPKAGAPKSDYEKLLSNHSRGTAIDLNAKWNPRGKSGAALGHVGCMGRIVAIADTIKVKQDDGSVWGIVAGANWKGASIDPMHFELGVWA